MFFDPLYLMIILVTLILSGWASAMVKGRFAQGRKVRITSGLTGAQVAAKVLSGSGIDDVKIVTTQGMLSDHYNPMTKTLALSKEVYSGVDASAAGIAAHEAGHALQHSERYLPLGLRSAIVPTANIGSRLGPWIIIAGILLGAARGSQIGTSLATIGVILFGASTLFTLVTLPVEFNASSRARTQLDQLGILRTPKERVATSRVLTAAGLTYVAAAISSLLMLLYWAARAGLLGGRSRD